MTVVPGGSVLQSAPPVCKFVSLSNGTLGDPVDTVHLVRFELSDTMPVHRGSIFVVIVFHMNHELVSPTGLYQRSWEGMVEDFARCFLKPIGPELRTYEV